MASRGNEALLIVHLSSLDSFSWHNGKRAAAELADALIGKVRTFDGLIVVMHQPWPLTVHTGPRLTVNAALAAASRVVWFAHDEERDDWTESMQRLGACMRGEQVTHVALGGFEASADEAAGCVNEVRRQLEAQGFTCRVEPALCGWYGEGPTVAL